MENLMQAFKEVSETQARACFKCISCTHKNKIEIKKKTPRIVEIETHDWNCEGFGAEG